MLENAKIGFIGGGVMGAAMIAGLTGQSLVDRKAMIVSTPLQHELDSLADRYGVHTTLHNTEAVQQRDIVVLAVKPQSLGQVAADLKGRIPTDALVISILAGVTLSKLGQQLHHYRVVRVMPNTPAQIGRGMSVWTCSDDVNDTQRQQATKMLSALGEALFVDNEDYLDMATALSGSGPAYMFMFMEALIDAGVHMGFSRRVAEQLVHQTIDGSLAFARESKRHPAELRNMVTSPAGTTAEALYQLEKGGFRTVVSKAIWAAYQKSRYLGGLNNDD